MMKQFVHLFLLYIFTFFISCDQVSHPSIEFNRIEELMPRHPDSALVLLRQAKEIETLSRKDKARYYLLLAEAQDKTYATHTTDSLISLATDYYEGTNDIERKAKAWYYKGRINQDLNLPLKAQECYLKALEEEGEIRDYALLGRINNYVGILYTYQNVYEKVIPYLRKAYKNFQTINDSIGQTYVLADLARTYQIMGKADSAQFTFEQALPYAKKAEATTIPSELGSLYLEKGMKDKAFQLIHTALIWTDNEQDRYPIYLSLGEYYLQVNNLDSANYYLTKALQSPSLYTRAGGYKYLYQVKRSQNDLKTAIMYNDQYEMLRDSLDKITLEEAIRTAESSYKYQDLKEALTKQELVLAKRDKERYLYAFLFSSILLPCFILYMKWKKVKEASLQREQEIMLSLEKQQQRNKAQKEENERQVSLLQTEIKNIKAQKDQELRIAFLQLKKQHLEVCNELIENEESKHHLRLATLRDSFIYKKFHENKNWQMKSEDWDELEKQLNYTYDLFIIRLKKICPKLSDVELKACMLTKIELSANQITHMLNYNSSVLRPRIYKKIFKKDGSVEEFVKFIIQF